MTLISASLVKSFLRGLLNLAVANSSLLSLYNPTVVRKVCGALMNEEYITWPEDPEINEGLAE